MKTRLYIEGRDTAFLEFVFYEASTKPDNAFYVRGFRLVKGRFSLAQVRIFREEARRIMRRELSGGLK